MCPSSTTSSGRFRSALDAIRDALSGKQFDYTQGTLPRAIALLAIPMVLEMAMESVFAICDVFFVSQLGDAAVATVGLTESMLTIIYAIAFGLAMATTAVVARRIGEQNIPGAVRAATQAILFGIGTGIVAGVVCFLYAPDLLAKMGAGPQVIEEGSSYTAILLGSNVVILLLFLNNAIFRGAGDAVVAMRALWIANGLNLILDPCLIFGLGPFPEMGVTGAAVATTCGRATGVIYQFWALHSGKSRLPWTGRERRFHWPTMKELLRVSSGGVAQLLIATASWVALMRIVTEVTKDSGSDSAVAGYTIAVRIVMFALLPAWGLANAAATLVGQNLGAGQPDRAERSVWLTGWFNTAFLGLVTLVFLLLGRPLVSIFTDQPETLEFGTQALRIMSYGYVFYAWGMVMMQAFNGAGDTMTPTWLNLFCFWLFQIPLAWTLAAELDWGPSGVFSSVAIAESVLAIVSIAVFRRGRWKHTQLAADEAADTVGSTVEEAVPTEAAPANEST